MTLKGVNYFKNISKQKLTRIKSASSLPHIPNLEATYNNPATYNNYNNNYNNLAIPTDANDQKLFCS